VSRGHDRERRVRHLLEGDGWTVVRSAGSLGPVDLVALRRDQHPLLVEVKSTLEPYQHFRREDRQLMMDIAVRAGASVVLAWWPSRRSLKWIGPREWPRLDVPQAYRNYNGPLPGGLS
jgi:Holliday junction resolvase